MKILYVLSQVHLTGAETYAVTLARGLRGLGHEVVLVSDRLEDAGGFRFIPLPIHGRNTSYWGRFLNVRALSRLMQAEDIDLVHSHSRAANLASHFGRSPWSGGRTPMVATIHGRWRNHFAFRRLPCLGERTVAVCPYLERYLRDDIGIPAARIIMIPNGIDAGLFSPGDGAGGSGLLFAGRLSGQKGNVVRFLLRSVLREVLRDFPLLHFKIAAQDPPAEDLLRVAEFNRAAGREAVTILARGGDMPGLYRGAEVVIGSGRVAMEAMACGRPVVAVGESSAPGLLGEENFEAAFDSNFGDCGDWNLFEKENRLAADLKRILGGSALRRSLSAWGRQKVLEKFELGDVARRIGALYGELA